MSVSLAVMAVQIFILIAVVIDDIRNFRIKNTVVAALLCLCFCEFLIRADARVFVAHVAFAAVAFAVLLIAFRRGLMGGGDTKLLTVAFLGIGPEAALVYSIFLLIFILIYWGGALIGVLPAVRIRGRLKVPFGPSIAGAWIATLIIQVI